MPHTSPYFNSVWPGQTAEQGLVDDLVREQIKIYGLDVLYMPRRHLNLDHLLHESTKVAFEMAMPIPMYLKTVDGFDNGMELLSKFGVRSSDEITLVMSRSEFTTYYSPYLKSYYNGINGDAPGSQLDPLIGEIDSRPKEGDLIFFPFDNSIFEIKYVQFDQPFFQLGRGYVFEIQCEKFEYSGEEFKTTYDSVDQAQVGAEYYRMDFEIDPGYTRTFDQFERVTIHDITGVGELYDEYGGYWDILYDGSDTHIIAQDGTYLATNVFEATPYDITTEEGDVIEHHNRPGGGIIAEGLGLRWDYGEEGLLQTDGVRNFIFHRDPGLLHRVDQVQGTVMDWNTQDFKLTVGELTDNDPQQEDANHDLTINRMDTVVIIGQTSGAYAVAHKAGTERKAFDDADVIQEEFDNIKIVDDFDENPFGFV